jgi:Lon-like protease
VYDAFEKAAYVDGAQIAAAVAERALGHQVAITSDGLEILAVQPGSPGQAAGLTNGDMISAINGVAASSNEQIPNAIAAAHGGSIELEIIRNGSQRTVRVTAAVLDGSASPVLGVIAGPANPTVDLPIPVKVDASGVVGPSAGLMTALTIYDELSPIDLAHGRHIAGTGTIDADGTVGEIGGIEAKARAAQASGAQLFLAPASQAAAARTVLGDRVPVIAVSTFTQALNALSARNQRAALS